MVFQRRSQLEEIRSRPGLAGRFEDDAMGIADADSGEGKRLTCRLDGLCNQFVHREAAGERRRLE